MVSSEGTSRRCLPQSPSSQPRQHPNTSYTATVPDSAIDRSLQATNQLLAHIACQLEQQTAELRKIKRSAASCDNKLSVIKRCLQQLVTLATITAEACCRVAAAAAEFLSAAASAESVSRLHLTINSGRFIMLLLLLVLCICSSASTVHKQCMGRLVPKGVFGSWLRLPALQAPKRVQWGPAGLLNSSYSWCIVRISGWYTLGMISLLAWTWWAWRQRTASQQPAKATAHDPLLSLLLTALQVRSSNLPLLAAVLSAALYEGVLGCVVVAAMSGRWAVWLCLWDLWLWCCYCRRSSMQQVLNGDKLTGLNQRQQQVHNQRQQQNQCSGYPVIYQSMLSSSCSEPDVSHQQQLRTRQEAGQHELMHLQTACTGVVHWVSNTARLQLAASQLLLPVAMAVAAVWR